MRTFAPLIVALLVACDGGEDTGTLPTDSDGDGHLGAADCDETSADVYVGAVEVCNGIDDNCDGLTDPDESVGAPTWYADLDADGYGDAAAPGPACAQPQGQVADATDCLDTDSAVHPDAPETCNGADDNCDGVTDPASAVDAPVWHPDGDRDGYGSESASATACNAPAGFLAQGDDCDDGNDAIHPGAADICNGVDDDCDGAADPDSAPDAVAWARDADGDGYGADGAGTTACSQPEGYVAVAGDCDDGDASISPAGLDVPADGVDQDCYGGDLVCADLELRDRVGHVAETTAVGAGDDSTPTCGGEAEDVSFHWVAPGDGTYTFRVVAADGGEAVLSIFAPGCEGAELECVAGASSASTTQTLTAGAERTLRVDASGAFGLTIDLPDERTCDDGADDGAADGADGLADCLDPECDGDRACDPTLADLDLGSALGDAVATGSTTAAADDWPGSCGGSYADDVGYAWVAPRAGTYAFSLEGSSYDTVLTLWSPDGAVELACSNSVTDGASRVWYAARAGELLLLVVDGNNRSSGSYVLGITEE